MFCVKHKGPKLLVREIRKLIDSPKPKGKTRSIGFIEHNKLKKK